MLCLYGETIELDVDVRFVRDRPFYIQDPLALGKKFRLSLPLYFSLLFLSSFHVK